MNRVKRHGAEDRLKGREQTKSACIATTRAKLTNSQELPGSALLNTGSCSERTLDALTTSFWRHISTFMLRAATSRSISVSAKRLSAVARRHLSSSAW